MFANEPDCDLVAVVDPDPAALRRAHAVAPHARTSGDLAAVIADRDVDALVIASPSPTHAALAIAALDAGKHVLIEKPLALSLADARRVAAVAARGDRVAMIGHLMVFHPAVVRMRELLRGGTLGTLQCLNATRVNLGRVRSDENVLWSFGAHDLSMIDFLVERSPVAVSASGQCVLQSGIEDVVFLSLRYATGELAHVHLSWLHPRKERRLTIVCSQKMLEFDDVAPDKLRIYDKGFDRPPSFTEFAEYLTIRDGDVHILGLKMHEPLRLEAQHFLQCIAGQLAPLTDLASALRVVATLEAAQRSVLADGVPVDIEPKASDLAGFF
ncbi:MAG: Gfo/Idh/MocA family oxidoreductase [Myxococcota bacterium]|nr:Gfo/Idh/MocA family oxidoreductase [Myxococcota bacterium]